MNFVLYYFLLRTTVCLLKTKKKKCPKKEKEFDSNGLDYRDCKLGQQLFMGFSFAVFIVRYRHLFTIRLKFVQIRKFPAACKAVFGNIKLFGKKADKDGISSFQSLATAIAAQVGTGNIAGAAGAIASGGPGAIFWMWLSAFFRYGYNL